MAGFNWGNLVNTIGGFAKSVAPTVLGGLKSLAPTITQMAPGLGGFFGNLIGGERGANIGASLANLGGNMLQGAFNPNGANTSSWQGALQGGLSQLPGLGGVIGNAFGAQDLGRNIGRLGSTLGNMGQGLYNAYQQAPNVQQFGYNIPGALSSHLPQLGQNVGAFFGQGPMGYNIGDIGSTVANMGQQVANNYAGGLPLNQLTHGLGQYFPNLGKQLGGFRGYVPAGIGEEVGKMTGRLGPFASQDISPEEHALNSMMESMAPQSEEEPVHMMYGGSMYPYSYSYS